MGTLLLVLMQTLRVLPITSLPHPPRPQPLAFSSLSLKTPAKAVPPTPGTVLQNKIQRNLEKSLGDSLNIHIQQQMGSFQASMLEAFQSLREELAVKKPAEVDPSPHASKAGPSSNSAAHLDLPPPRSSTNAQSEAMDVDVGPALPPRLVLNQTSSDQYVAHSEAIPKDSSYSHKKQSHRQTVAPSSASDQLVEDSDEPRIHPRPKKHSDKSKHKSRSRYVSSSEEDHSPVARHRSSKPSRAQPSGAASDQDLPQHDPDPPYYREVALSDIPSQYSEEVDTFRRILSLPDPRDSMPRSSTSVLGLDDEKGRQELRPRGPSSILPLSSVIKDAFDKFQHDFKAANLSEGKYVKPPPSTSKWYKVGQPTFQDKIQELNTDFAKICITLRPPGAPAAKVPLPVLKELEHQARQNISTLNFTAAFAKTSSSCNVSLEKCQHGIKSTVRRNQKIKSQIQKGANPEKAAKPTHERWLKLQDLILRLKSKRVLTARCLMSLIGLLASTEKMVPEGRLHMRPFQFHLKEHWRYPQSLDNLLPWTEAIVAHLNWWQNPSNVMKGADLHPKDHSIQLFTDASNEGWGDHLDQNSTKGLWSEREKRLHINVLELKAVSLALRDFKDQCQNQTVLVATDNSTVVAYINKQGGTHSAEMCALLWKIMTWCHHYHITLKARHIPGCLNVMADLLSRSNQVQSTEWSLHRQVFKQICRKWFTPHVDLFATHLNHKLPLYVSPIPDPRAWNIDALNINWTNLTAYAYPPTALLHKVIQKIKQCHCLIIVIAPGWPGMPWFWDLVQLSTEIPLQLPVSMTLLKQSHNYVFHNNPQQLNLHAWERTTPRTRLLCGGGRENCCPSAVINKDHLQVKVGPI